MSPDLQTPFGAAARHAETARLERQIALMRKVTRWCLIGAIVIGAATFLADAALSTALALPGIAADAVARAAW